MHLAQFNIGRLAYDIDDPRVADFVAGVEMLNRIAERSAGFVWKYETGVGGVVTDEVDDDPRIVVNLTVWETVDALHHYVFNTLHKHFLNRRVEWFTPLDRAHFVMWPVAAGHRPSLAEARAKLDVLRTDGSSEEAFGWDWLTMKTGQQA